MARIRHLGRAPITEALIDLRVEVRRGVEAAALLAAQEALRGTYPVVQQTMAMEARVGVGEGGAVEAGGRSLGLYGVIAKSLDAKTVVQFRVDGFTFNRLKPYTSWDELLPEALASWARYVEAVRPDGVKRVGVRYINHLPLAGAADLLTLIETMPRLPVDVNGVLDGFAGRVILRDASSDVRASVVQALEDGGGPDERVLRLDIDAFTDGDRSLDRPALEATLARLREFKNRVFFGTLTETFVQKFE